MRNINNGINNSRTTHYKEMYEFMLNTTEKRPLTVLSNDFFSMIFFKESIVKNRDSKLIFRLKKPTGFNSFLKTHSVDYIYISTQKVITTKNIEMNNFMTKDYVNYGFQKISPHQGVPYSIFVRKEL